jgi:excisionase family DNA binding protein
MIQLEEVTMPTTLTTDQVASQLQVHRITVQRWLREGRLRGTKLPGKAGWRIDERELVRFLGGTPERSSALREYAAAHGLDGIAAGLRE